MNTHMYKVVQYIIKNQLHLYTLLKFVFLAHMQNSTTIQSIFPSNESWLYFIMHTTSQYNKQKTETLLTL